MVSLVVRGTTTCPVRGSKADRLMNVVSAQMLTTCTWGVSSQTSVQPRPAHGEGSVGLGAAQGSDHVGFAQKGFQILELGPVALGEEVGAAGLGAEEALVTAPGGDVGVVATE